MLSDSTLQLAQDVVKRALADGVTIGCVESCTGGLVGAAITSVDGSSGAFMGSVVSYHNDVKAGCVGVERRVLEGEGAVSGACAAQMALGGLVRLGVDRCVSVTGIAGPGGGTKKKPVGTVWFGLAARDADGVVVVRILVDEPQERARIREEGVVGALTLLDPEFGGDAIRFEQERAVRRLSEVLS
jgi:PncC family amidohydrolase